MIALCHGDKSYWIEAKADEGNVNVKQKKS